MFKVRKVNILRKITAHLKFGASIMSSLRYALGGYKLTPRFSVLPKEISACGLEEMGLNLVIRRRPA